MFHFSICHLFYKTRLCHFGCIDFQSKWQYSATLLFQFVHFKEDCLNWYVECMDLKRKMTRQRVTKRHIDCRTKDRRLTNSIDFNFDFNIVFLHLYKSRNFIRNGISPSVSKMIHYDWKSRILTEHHICDNDKCKVD